MKSLFVGIIFISSTMAFAQELNFQEYRKFLMSGNQGSGNKIALQTTCTTSTGQVYRIGEKDYDTCLAAVKNQHQMKELSGSKDSTLPEAAAGATIHIGN